ncbi:hypothetical protein [Rhodococcus kronopolitis]|uniref:Uncharacterized protein n=1 Tax=Rhodococcus kronopolitis TaxID=1460226 RepID=A0ABV9FR50_9NOCA
MASTGEECRADGSPLGPAGAADGGFEALRAAIHGYDGGAAERLDAAVHRYRRGISAQVTGRAGVGRSAVLAALAGVGATVELVESEAWDVPGTSDPELTGEVVVLVLAGPPRPADLRAARAAPPRSLAVLNKSDALDDPAALAAAAGSELGLVCLPVSACAGPDGDGDGVDVARAAVRGLVDAVRADRAAAVLSVLRGLTGMATARDDVEAYLAGDAGVRLAADSHRSSAEGRAPDLERADLARRRNRVRAGERRVGHA